MTGIGWTVPRVNMPLEREKRNSYHRGGLSSRISLKTPRGFHIGLYAGVVGVVWFMYGL